MKIVFHASDKAREQELAATFCAGARIHGHDARVRLLTATPEPEACDLACVVGVKSKRLWQAYGAKFPDTHRMMLDKGYSRHRGPNRTWEYWRVSLDAQHPTGTTLMSLAMPLDRLAALDLEIQPWRNDGDAIIIAGSSAKYHDFHGLHGPTEWAEKVIKRLGKRTKRPIIYRPKPSWRDAVPIAGSIFSGGSDQLGALLQHAHVLITHGSNACFDAAMAGIPSIVLGDAVALPISSTDLDEIERPKRSPHREQWAANLAYHQFTEIEFASGFAFDVIGGWMSDARL